MVRYCKSIQAEEGRDGLYLSHLYILSFVSEYPRGSRDVVNASSVPLLNPSPNPDFKSANECHGHFDTIHCNLGIMHSSFSSELSESR